MAKIIGFENMEHDEIQREVKNGGKFVMYEYTVSILIMTFKQPTSIYFIKSGESAVSPGLKYSLLSFIVGWWGLPWGFIYTPMAIAKNMTGGTDVTGEAMGALRDKRRAKEGNQIFPSKIS